MNRNILAERILVSAGVLTIVAIAALLRFPNLGISPGWDADEGYNLNIAWNLSQGRLQMFALSYPFVQHPPLFYLASLPFLALGGIDIVSLRILTATYGVLTTGLLYFLGCAVQDRKVGLFASLLYAIYPLAVLHNRWAYSYNQLAFLTVATIYCLIRGLGSAGRAQTVWLALAGLAAGLGFVTDQEGLVLILVLAIALVALGRRLLPLVLSVALAPYALYWATFLILMPQAFLFDWTHTTARVITDPATQILQLAVRYRAFLEMDYWLALGLVGLFLAPGRRERSILILSVATLLTIILSVRNVNPYFRTAVPLLPLISLGLALFVDRAIAFVYTWLSEAWREAFGPLLWPLRSILVMGFLAAVLGAPIAIATGASWLGTTEGFRTKIDFALATKPTDAHVVAGYVNEHAAQDDVVIASSHISWLLHAPAADLFQAIAAEGQAVGFYPAALPKERFIYDPQLPHARFFVADDFIHRWAEELDGREAELLREVESQWRPVFIQGEYTVYANPTR